VSLEWWGFKCRSIQTRVYGDWQFEVFLESFTIASACNKIPRKRFSKPDTIGVITDGGYSCNNNYRKNALMWLMHMEHMDFCWIMHERNGRKNRQPELPIYIVDGNCPDTKTIYEILVVIPGYICQPFRDVCRIFGDTLAERFERTMSRLEPITGAGI